MLIGLVLTGCCMGGAPTAPAIAPGTTAVCPPIETAILGTWSRDGYVEEYREGGVYVINAQVGTIRWLGAGRAFLDVPPNLHHEYTLALADTNVLVASDPGNVGTFYQRMTPPPAMDATCTDIRDEIVGTWAGGAYAETYNADGSYRVNALSGTYRFDGNGLLHIETEAGPGDYYFALTSPTSGVAMMRVQGAPAVNYTRTGP